MKQWEDKMRYACWFAGRYGIRMRVRGVRVKGQWLYRTEFAKGEQS